MGAWKDAFRLAWRLSLLHHPLCHVFHEDGLRLGRVRVCSGCALALPGLVVGLLLSSHLLRHVPPHLLLALGLVLGVPQLATYRWRGGRLARAATKLVGGLGLGAVFVAGAWLPAPLPWKLAALVALGLAFMALQGVRLASVRRACRACPWQADWEACPGFRHDPARDERTRLWKDAATPASP